MISNWISLMIHFIVIKNNVWNFLSLEPFINSKKTNKVVICRRRNKFTDLYYVRKAAVFDFFRIIFYGTLRHFIEFLEPKTYKSTPKLCFCVK